MTQQLRKAIKASGRTRYALSKETGIHQSSLSRFIVSGRGLKLANVDRLCAALGLHLSEKGGKR